MQVSQRLKWLILCASIILLSVFALYGSGIFGGKMSSDNGIGDTNVSTNVSGGDVSSDVLDKNTVTSNSSNNANIDSPDSVSTGLTGKSYTPDSSNQYAMKTNGTG